MERLSELRAAPCRSGHSVASRTWTRKSVEQVCKGSSVLDHRKVSGWHLDRLDSQQLARDESLPFRCEELVVPRENQRRRDSGMLGERIVPCRRGAGS